MFPSCSAWSGVLVGVLPLLQGIYPCTNTQNINEQAGYERLKEFNGNAPPPPLYSFIPIAAASFKHNGLDIGVPRNLNEILGC